MTHPVLLIASPVEEELVEGLRGRLPEWSVRHDARLIPAPQYPNDHVGHPPELDDIGLHTWRSWLAEADAMLDFDWWQPQQMSKNCPRLRWVQSTSAGIGSYISRYNIDHSRVAITTAAGVHASSLAEFALAGLLYHVRDLAGMERDRHERRWIRTCAPSLSGRTAAVIGMGNVGQAVAGVLETVGVRVCRFDRARMQNLRGTTLGTELSSFDAIVLALPSTSETRDLIDAEVLSMLCPRAILVNVGRGDVLDQEALVEALQQDRIAGAVLDVTRTEPPPPHDLIWSAPRLLLSPHSAGNTTGENARIMDILVENAHRLIRGEDLNQRYRPERCY